MLDATLTPAISRLLQPFTDPGITNDTFRENLTLLLVLLRDNDHPCPLLEDRPPPFDIKLATLPYFKLNLSTQLFTAFRLSVVVSTPRSTARHITISTTYHLSFDLDPHTNQYLPSISS